METLSSALELTFSVGLPSTKVVSPTSEEVASPAADSLTKDYAAAPSHGAFTSNPRDFFGLYESYSTFAIYAIPGVTLVMVAVAVATTLSASPDVPSVATSTVEVDAEGSLCYSGGVYGVLFFFPSTDSFRPRFSLSHLAYSSMDPSSLLSAHSEASSTIY